MRSKPFATDEFGYTVKQKPCKDRPIWSVGQAKVLIALLGISLAVLSSQTPASSRVSTNGPKIVGRDRFVVVVRDGTGRARVENFRVHEQRLADRENLLRRIEPTGPFLIKGDAEIDVEFAKTAREIDARMIHDPNRRANSRPAMIPFPLPGKRPGSLILPPIRPLPHHQ